VVLPEAPVKLLRPTHAPRRRGRRVALLARYPDRDRAMPQFISNHGMRMVEAMLRASALEELELRTWDLVAGSVDSLAQEVAAFDPDVVGVSAYLWSFPYFIEVARALKEDDPGRLIVFGGPSARPSMMSLPPFRAASRWVDALVINEGEHAFREIIALPERSSAALMTLAGLALPADGGWIETAGRPLGDLNELPSPYAMDLAPKGGLGVLQTYRGCPFTCSFCEWGTLESPKRVREVDALCREFEGMARHDVAGALEVDAGLNLNQHAFHNLLLQPPLLHLRDLSGQGAPRAHRVPRVDPPAAGGGRPAVFRQRGAEARRALLRRKTLRGDARRAARGRSRGR
jgi:hypothetical protein